MSKFRNQPFFSKLLPPMILINAMKHLGLSLNVFKIIQTLDFNPKTKAQKFAGYEPTSHDVFACVYSKSGTNWLLQAIQQTIWYGEADFDHIHSVVAWPDPPFPGIVALDDPRPMQDSPAKLRAIKTSFPSTFVPYRPGAKYITVLRDPKEVFVSTYHFFPSVFGMQDRITVEQWLDHFLSRKFFVGCWAEHTASWWALRHRPNVLVLSFAQMNKDLEGAVRQLVDHLGVSLNPGQFSQVVEKCDFQYMKAHESQFGPPIVPLVGNKKTPDMMRQGKSGSSGELLSRAQQARIDAYFIAELERLNSDFPYRGTFNLLE